MPPNTLSLLLLALVGCVPDLVSDGPAGGEPWTAPDNSWPTATPPDDLEGEGFHTGEVIPDFRLVDQHGDEVSLWQFYGRVVVVDISTMWCAPCRELAEGAEATYQEWRDRDVIYVTVLPENVEGQAPSIDDLGLWVDEYGLTTPVVADPGEAWSARAVPQDQYPFVAVVGADLRVAARPDPPTDGNVRSALAAVLGE